MPISSDSMRDRWLALAARVGRRGDAAALWTAISALYNSPARAYHSLVHIRDCLTTLDGSPGLTEDAGSVEFALWFHDAVYDARAKDNEERSADVAAVALRELGADAETQGRVRQLILVTKHQAPPADADAALIADIDLAILGSAPERYLRYTSEIRSEYSYLDDATFCAGRGAFVEAMLTRPILFHTAVLRERFETQARANLAEELRRWLAMDHGSGGGP